MVMLPLCDEQRFIFQVNEKGENLPMKIVYTMKFSKGFSLEELSDALERCMKSADVFSSKILLTGDGPQMVFLPYEKKNIPVMHFDSEEAYMREVGVTKINNRDQLYDLFIYAIAKGPYHLHFAFNHLIFDGQSAFVFGDKILEALVHKEKEITWHPFSAYLEKLKKYRKSTRYLEDEEFWTERFSELSQCKDLFPDLPHGQEGYTQTISFQTSEQMKRDLVAYCEKNRLSPQLLIVTVLAECMHEKTHGSRFYLEVPVGNRLGRNEKNSVGPYEVAFPLIVDFSQHKSMEARMASLQKQSMAYYKHSNFPWSSTLATASYVEKYGRYNPQFSFSYLCHHKKQRNTLVTLQHHHLEMDVLPVSVLVSDYVDWQAMTFSYTYFSSYFTEEEMFTLHQQTVRKIETLMKNDVHEREES